MTERFHTGWNQVFQQTTETPICHPTWPEAAEFLQAFMREYADADDEEAFAAVDWDLVTPEREASWLASDEAPAMLAHVAAVLRHDGPREPHDYLAVIEDHNYRRIAFWLRKVVCDDDGHQESEL